MNYLALIIPILAASTCAILAVVLIFKRQKSLLQKITLFCTLCIVLLQMGTVILATNIFQQSKMLGGNFVIYSLVVLTPLCTTLALLWGKSNGKESLGKYRPALISQWIISCAFLLLNLIRPFLFINDRAAISVMTFSTAGQFFLIYLILSSVLILAIFEQKLRVLRGVKQSRIPTIIFMGIFALFIVVASQGLLVKTLNPGLLVLISLCIFFGCITPRLSRFKNFITFDNERETVYSSVVILWVGAYLIVIGILGKLISMIGQDVQVFFSVVAVSAAVFLFFIIMTSFSWKRGIRKLVDRTFFRGSYDYRNIWSRFSAEISFNLDVDSLNQAFLNTTTDFLGVEKGAILLVQEGSTNFTVSKKKI